MIQNSWGLPFSSVELLSHVRLFVTPWISAHQASLPITNSRSSLKLTFIESLMPSSHLILCRPLLLLTSVFSAPGSLTMSQFFTSDSQRIGASASTSTLQDWFPLGLTGLISLQSKDSQEPSPTPQFKSINSSALSFLQSPTLKSIHDHRKNHSLD